MPLQHMTPGRKSAIIGNSVVPTAVLVHLQPGCEAGACRNADWRIGISVCEARATRCQTIKVRRPDHGTTIAAEHLLSVLIIHDDE